MTKYKIAKPLEMGIMIPNTLSLEEIGLMATIMEFENSGLEITIDNLKKTTSENKIEIRKIINQLIEKNYLEEI